MELLLAIVGMLLFAAVILVVMLIARRRRERRAPHDDLQRVGGERPASPEDAAGRAEGEAAWMRPPY